MIRSINLIATEFGHRMYCACDMNGFGHSLWVKDFDHQGKPINDWQQYDLPTPQPKASFIEELDKQAHNKQWKEMQETNKANQKPIVEHITLQTVGEPDELVEVFNTDMLGGKDITHEYSDGAFSSANVNRVIRHKEIDRCFKVAASHYFSHSMVIVYFEEFKQVRRYSESEYKMIFNTESIL